MKKIFFSSDNHYFHDNIRRHCNRPFLTTREMDEYMTTQWNAVVGKNDDIYHLGDFAWRNAGYALGQIQKLNGRIHLLRGNHDKRIFKGPFREKLEQSFIWIKDYYELTVQDPDVRDGKQLIILCHYPFISWNKSHWGSWSLYGHTHRELEEDKNSYRYHVGVDTNHFTPISYEQIKDIMKTRR